MGARPGRQWGSQLTRFTDGEARPHLPWDPAFNRLKAAQAGLPCQAPPALASQQLSPLAQAASCLDLSLVTPIYSSALSSFLTKRNSPLTVPMFLSLFARHPVSIGRGCPLGPLLGPILTAHHFLHRCSVRTYSPSWSST